MIINNSCLVIQLPLKISWCVKTTDGEKRVSLEPLGNLKFKSFILNLNNYRNAHQAILHESKLAYHIFIGRLIDAHTELKGFFLGKKVKIEFKYWHHDKRKLDVSNPVAIIEKFACDALVEHGVIDDDNYEVITEHGGWTFMGIDKELYPHGMCEMFLTEIK
jgi:hypothetical protein